MIYYSF